MSIVEDRGVVGPLGRSIHRPDPSHRHSQWDTENITRTSWVLSGVPTGSVRSPYPILSNVWRSSKRSFQIVIITLGRRDLCRRVLLLDRVTHDHRTCSKIPSPRRRKPTTTRGVNNSGGSKRMMGAKRRMSWSTARWLGMMTIGRGDEQISMLDPQDQRYRQNRPCTNNRSSLKSLIATRLVSRWSI